MSEATTGGAAPDEAQATPANGGYYEYEYHQRLAQPMSLKLGQFETDGRLDHVIFAQQFDRGRLDHLGGIATLIRTLARHRRGADFLADLAPHKRAMLYFAQPSTRTFLSFMASCQILGITCNEVRDTRVSSEAKGENRFDSMRMFSSYFDLVVMRTVEPQFAECCAYLMNDLNRFSHRSVPIVNAGSGADQHPTQALLDVYTIQRTFDFRDPGDSPHRPRLAALRQRHPHLRPGPGGKTYVFCGDIGRGRTVRSLALLLALYEDVRMVFVSPDHPSLRLAPPLRDWLAGQGVQVEEAFTLDDVMEEADCLYMTRIQTEHNTAADADFLRTADMAPYRLTPPRVARMKEYAPILHPFPRVDEIPMEIDNDPRAMYFRQARNGMWIRAALLAHLVGVDGRIASHALSGFGDR